MSSERDSRVRQLSDESASVLQDVLSFFEERHAEELADSQKQRLSRHQQQLEHVNGLFLESEEQREMYLSTLPNFAQTLKQTVDESTLEEIEDFYENALEEIQEALSKPTHK